MHQLMEDSWDDSLSVDLEVEASLLSQSQELLKHKASGLFEDRIDAGVQEAGVRLAVLLGDQDLVLDVKVRNIVLQVDVL